jgi:tetratricopeptide (TPR) repeat protein
MKNWRTVCGRLALVVVVPVVFFGLLEGILYLTGAFEPLSAIRQVEHQGKMFWTSEPRYGRFILQRENAPPPSQLWLPVERTQGRLRVAMLGESAAAGFPLDEFNLARMTRVLWDERFPDEPMEVANLTMTGINSHVLRVFAEEAMKMDPDVVVLYAGHNEAVGPYGPMSTFTGALPSEKLAQLSMWARNTRTGRAVERAMEGGARLFKRSGPGSWVGLDEFGQSRMAADHPALDRMAEQTLANFRAIIQTALDHGCKVLVCVPAVNLTDWPPPASAEGEADVSAQAAYDEARELEAAGRREEAWELYRRACDLDLLRLRADSRVRGMQRELVAEFATPDVALVDADLWLHEWNPVFRSDSDYFLEHVHLTFDGRVAVASLMVAGIAELTGHTAAAGVGRAGYAGMDTWWQDLPRRIGHSREALFFTEFDEGQIWKKMEKLLGMDVFAGLVDRDRRRSAAKERSEAQLAAARERFGEEEIRSTYAAASKLNSDEWVDHSAAQLWYSIDQAGEFWQAIDAAHAKYPYFRLAHYEMASRAIRQKRFEEALDHARALDDTRSSEDMVPDLFGEIYWAWGKPEKAIPFLERAVANKPKDPVSWFNLAMARQMAGQQREAVADFRRALEAEPGSVKIRSALAKLLLDQERPTAPDLEEALKLARELRERQPDSLDARLVLAVALMANRRGEEAQSVAGELASRVTLEKGEAEAAYIQKALGEARVKYGAKE